MDDYKLLGISGDSSVSEIRRAYVAKAKQTHPDSTRTDTSADFKEVTEAYHRVLRQRPRAAPKAKTPKWRPVEYPTYKSIRPTSRVSAQKRHNNTQRSQLDQIVMLY